MRSHWSERYVGLAYVPGTLDCARLVERVLQEQFGRRDIHLPAPEHPDNLAEGALVRDVLEDYVVRIEQPEEGDGVLMMARGRPSHIGIFCLIGHRRYVLHALRQSGRVCLHTPAALARMWLPVEGYYRWR